jgi:hypothetical protein
MDGHFIRGGQAFRIAAKEYSKEKEIQVILSQEMAANYRVEKKDLPGNLPMTWQDSDGRARSVEWINNFGIKKIGKPDFEQDEIPESYEIILDEFEGKRLVYYDSRDRQVKPFSQEDLGKPKDLPGKISARLKLGDPPIGTG